MTEELVKTINSLVEAYVETQSAETLKHIHTLRSQQPRIAFFCETGGTSFIKEIYEFFNERYPTRLFVGNNMKHLEAVYEWCDIAWFEWCTNQVVYASKLPKKCKTICRLHRYEAFANWPREVNWENIDVLINIGNAYVMHVVREAVPDLDKRTKSITLLNAVNTNKFSFIEKEPNKNIGCIGFGRIIKNPMLMLQCLHKLRTIDPEYKLYFAGSMYNDKVLEQYLCYMIQELELTGSVFFDGHQNDINAWLQDKSFVVSASVVEGCPVNILEAMSCGIKPVIHTWPGARDFFPQELIFRTVDEFCDRIHKDEYKAQAYRNFVVSNYSLSQQLDILSKLIVDLKNGNLNVQ